MFSLTIAIPTFDRNDKLKRTVESLLPQLRSGVKLIIVDNCSKTPVSVTLAEFPLENVSIVRNKQNIGMSGNFAKCFELCDTKWLWIIGDDDPMKPDAVNTVISVLNREPDLSFINFKSVLASQRVEDFTVSSQIELVNKLDDFGNFLYISLCVYNVKKFASDYRYLYQYGYTFAPHIALVIAGLRDREQNHKFLFSKEELVDNAARDTSVEETWNWIGLSLVIFLLYELTLDMPKNDAKKMQLHLATHVIKPKQVYSEIAKIDPSLSEFNRDVYWFDQIFLRAKGAMTFRNCVEFLYYRFRMLLKKILYRNKSVVRNETSIYERF